MRDDPRIGVVVPARNEAAVLGRRLANLARLEWPDSAAPHRVLVVDDQSTDGTAEVARSLGAELFRGPGPELEVLANPRGGKAGAVATALERLEAEGFDLVVVTDADVVVATDALRVTADAFRRDPRLGLACGAQTHVGSLDPDGEPPAAPRSLDGPYDRLTAWVRALESRGGRLVSVHGQWMAWPLGLGLRLPPGEVSDDIALGLDVRRHGLRVERLPRARFFELRTPPAAGARPQALRRARGYLQFVADPGRGPGGGALDGLHWAFYRYLPRYAPEWLPALALLLTGATVLAFGFPGAVGAAALLGLLAVSGTLGRLARFLGLLRDARRAAGAGRLSDRWEMQRP